MSRTAGLGRIDFVVRRVSGLVLVAFFTSYLILLAREGRAIWLGDVGRIGGPLAMALELALIALLSFHAFSGLAHWAMDRLGSVKHHRFGFAISVVLALAVVACHLPTFYGWP